MLDTPHASYSLANYNVRIDQYGNGLVYDGCQ